MQFPKISRPLAGLSLAGMLLLAACGTPAPTPTAIAPTAAPAATSTVPAAPPTDTAVPPAPTDTAVPPAPTDTAVPPAPTDTAAPPTATQPPAPATVTPAPTTAPAASWQLVAAAVKDPSAALTSGSPPATVYAGGTGVLRSTDAGQTWAALTTAFPVQEIAVAPSDPQVIYAGTGEGCASGKPGLLERSTDGGQTWTAVTGGPIRLSVDPHNAQTVLGLRCGGVDKSTDGGQTWTHLAGSGVTNYDGLFLVRAPSDANTLYAVYASEGGTPALQRTTDGGQTWTNLPAVDQPGPRDFTVDPTNAKHVYLLGMAGFLSSADGGQTWNPHNTGLSPAGANYQLSTLAIDTVSPPPAGAAATLYASAGGLPDGTPQGVLRWNGNNSWVPLAPAPDGHAIYQLLAVRDPAHPALLALTDAGLYRLPLR